MSYTVELTTKAERGLDALAKSPAFDQVRTDLRRLGTQPRPPGCKLIAGATALWRARSGDYRILYRLDDAHELITIVWIGHRRDLERAVRGLP